MIEKLISLCSRGVTVRQINSLVQTFFGGSIFIYLFSLIKKTEEHYVGILTL